MRRLALTIVVVGCTAPPPAPDPVRVEPPWGYSDSDTTVRVVGTSFFPSLGVSAMGGDEVVDDGFAVRLLDGGGLVSASLVGVQLEDLNTLVGVVPAGLAPGDYDVEVVAPSGQIGVEPDAFSIRPTRVERVDLDVDAVSHEVFTEAEVTVALRGQDGEVVPEDLPVRLVFERTDGGAFLGQVRIDGLEDPVTTRAEASITLEGRVGGDGVATLFPVLENPGELEVSVEAPDAPVRVVGDELRVAWTRGRSIEVRVTLPAPDFVATAGEPFTATLQLVDQFGNPAPDVDVPLAITDACSSIAVGVRVVGSEDVTVTPLQATNTTRCAIDRLVVSGAGVSGESEAFEVLPADAVGLEVVAGPSPVRAGSPLSMFVSAVDAWGNLTPWSGEVATIDDGVGGLSDVACSAPDQLAYCIATPLRAGSGLRLLVESAEGLLGLSNPITVRAGAPTWIDGVTASTWVAGRPEVLQPVPMDAYGNVVSDAVVDLGALVVTDPRAEVACAPDGAALACVLTTATGTTTLSLSGPVDDGGTLRTVVGTTGPLTVVHGALARVEVRPAATAVVAGSPLAVALAASDAWGNAFTNAPGTLVDLSDTLGGADPRSVALDGGGQAQADVVLRRAGTTRVEASAGGVVLGRSVPVEVLAGPASRLEILGLVPWAWVGEPAPFRVDAVDVEGNKVALGEATVRVSSRDGNGPPMLLTLVNGSGTASFVWTAWDAGDALLAETTTATPALSGTGRQLTVLARCGAAGPSAVVRFAGQTYARACFDPGGRASVAGDFAASAAAPGRTLQRFGLSLDGEPSTSTSTRVTVTTTQAGIHPLGAFVQQDDGCGAETRAAMYVGPDDDAAVGPISVTLSGQVDLTLPAPEALVQVDDLTTCHGVPAAGAVVRVRADRGELVDAVASGAGLELVADAAGTARARLDLGGATTGGPTTVTAWSPARTALGAATVEVVGDLAAPTVWAQAPEGDFSEPVELVELVFSEPLDPSSLTDGRVGIVGPGQVDLTLALLDDGRTLHLYPDVPLQPGLGQWVVFVEAQVTDLAGNALDGAWAGRASRYEGLLGLASTPIVVSSCQVDASVVRPDGDPGVGPGDGDEVALSYTAGLAPAWWGLAVRDVDDEVVVATQVVATAASGTWVWDGRDATGRVVPTGFYTVSVQAEDARGNRGNACERTVVVDLVEQGG